MPAHRRAPIMSATLGGLVVACTASTSPRPAPAPSSLAAAEVEPAPASTSTSTSVATPTSADEPKVAAAPERPAPAGSAPRVVAALAVGGPSTGSCELEVGGHVRCFDRRWRRLAGLRDVVELSAGDTHHCARTGAGAVYCWGEWYFGPTNHDGLPSDFLRVARPRRIAGLAAVDLEALGDSDCAVAVDGTVWCWGRLGDDSLKPVQRAGESGVVGLDTSTWWWCFRKGDRTARCDSMDLARPRPPIDLVDVSALALGDRRQCALHGDGRVGCWGAGPVGDGTAREHVVPVLVDQLADAVEVRVGEWHTCARSRDGIVRCWGSNHAGQLGDGTAEERVRPTLVQGIPQGRIVAIAADATSSAAWTDAGELWRWGEAP